jgi:hypothetical protein
MNAILFLLDSNYKQIMQANKDDSQIRFVP